MGSSCAFEKGDHTKEPLTGRRTGQGNGQKMEIFMDRPVIVILLMEEAYGIL